MRMAPLLPVASRRALQADVNAKKRTRARRVTDRQSAEDAMLIEVRCRSRSSFTKNPLSCTLTAGDIVPRARRNASEPAENMMRDKSRGAVLESWIGIVVLFSCVAMHAQELPYRNPALPVEQRVA